MHRLFSITVPHFLLHPSFPDTTSNERVRNSTLQHSHCSLGPRPPPTWPTRLPASAFSLRAPHAAPAHTAATAVSFHPRVQAPPHPPPRPALRRDAFAASPLFSSRVPTQRLSAPFCCWSPSPSVGLFPFSRCKLCLLRLGLFGLDGKTQKEAGWTVRALFLCRGSAWWCPLSSLVPCL